MQSTCAEDNWSVLKKKRQNFLEISFFSIRFWRWAKNFRPSWKILSAGLWNLHFTWSWEHFWEKKLFFWKLLYFYLSRTLSNFFGGRRCKNCNWPVHKNTLVRNFLRKNFLFFVFFGHRANNFWTLWQKTLSRSVKTALWVIIGTSSSEILFCEKIYTLFDLFRRLR